MLNLSQKDITYFEELQRDYYNTINYYNDLADHMTSWEDSISTNKHFLTKTGLTHDIHKITGEEKNKTTQYFIDYILNYLVNTYGLSSLTTYCQSHIMEKYVDYKWTELNGKNDELTYQDVIQSVCDELNIDDFASAEIDELRKRCIDKFKYDWERERIVISDKKVKLTEWGVYAESYSWDNMWCNMSDDCHNKYKDIFSAYNYINYAKIEIPLEIKTLLDKLNRYHGTPTDEFYTTHNLIGCIGIKSMKFYKNHNAEFKFASNEYRDKFIRVMKGEF